MGKIEKVDIQQAVKKLISQVYYDKSNTNLHLRKQLVSYLNKYGYDQLVDRVQRYLSTKKAISPSLEELINEIGYKVIPKSATPKKPNTDKQFVTNKRSSEEYEVRDINLIIDAPLEIHVLSVLWLMKLGVQLDAQLSDTCYGNRLVLKEDSDEPEIESGRILLKPYIKQYQIWRDEGIRKTKAKLDEGNDVAFINLDISSFYYFVRIDWDLIDLDFYGSSSLKKLHQILKRIHQHYTEIVAENYSGKCVYDGKSDLDLLSSGRVLLPLGLVSSYTLANHYLTDFDRLIEEEINPEYYGRYVDDIVLVLNKPKPSYKLQPKKLEKLISYFEHEINVEDDTPESTLFILNNLSELFQIQQINKKGSEDDEYRYIFRNTDLRPYYDRLFIQNRKVLVYEFKEGHSKSVIEKLVKDVEEKSSEFQFLPTDGDANFDTDAFELLYDDSFGKPRTLKDYKESKLGLATYLYRRSSVALWADKGELSDESGKILAFFKGINLINFYQYWERVFTYLIIAQRKQELIDLVDNCLEEIKRIEVSADYKTGRKDVVQTLTEYLIISIAQASSLDPQFIIGQLETVEFDLTTVFYNRKNFSDDLDDELLDIIVDLRNTSFVRNFYVIHALSELTDWGRNGKSVEELPSLISKKFGWKNINPEYFTITVQSKKIPRFIRFFEVSVFLWYQSVLKKDWQKVESGTTFLKKSKKLFRSVNGIDSKELLTEIVEDKYKKLKPFTSKNQDLCISEIHVDQNNSINYETDIDAKNQIAVGLANMKVNWQNEASRSVRGTPVVNKERYSRISDLLNKFVKEEPNTDLAVLPECSIPHDYLDLMMGFTKRNQKGLIFGMEHVNDGEFGYNFIMTCLPVELNRRNDAVLIPRLKNHYSHEEQRYITGYGLKVAENQLAQYHLFKWRNLYFTNFYCFELADIAHRSLFRSKIDLLVASEFNKDVEYFSSIIESTARDLNTLVAQSNSSQFGDNRIRRPAKSYYKNLARVDGGDNDLIIISKIDFKEIREHQIKKYTLQKDDKVYKPSPPNFEVKFVHKRIKGEWIFND